MRLALSLMLDPEWLSATLPLFERGEIDALEWSFDPAWGRPIPEWASRLLDSYAEAGALYGHGVHLSPLSAEWTPRQAEWIERLREDAAKRHYVHVSEHFGWSTAGPFCRGAPMPLPRGAAALSIGRDRLLRLADACARPVGLENLALTMRRSDAEALPDFLDALLEPVDGIIVLDLHNLFCQASNFALDPVGLMRRYPRERVRALHVSGGHWAEAAGRRFRRDTHDDAVPHEVHELLDAALELFDIELVVVERLGDTLRAPHARADFANQIQTVGRLAHRRPSPEPREIGSTPPPSVEPVEDPELAKAQAAWLRELAGEPGPHDRGPLAAWLDEADPAALETARVLAERWLRRQA